MHAAAEGIPFIEFFGVMFPCSHGLWGSTVPAQQPGSPWQAGFDVPLGWDKGLVAASPCQRPVPPFRRTLPPLLSIIARCHSPFCVTQQNSRQLFPSRLARPGVLFMTLSSSLVGLRPAGDLPPNLRHAACPARRRWQGRSWESSSQTLRQLRSSRAHRQMLCSWVPPPCGPGALGTGRAAAAGPNPSSTEMSPGAPFLSSVSHPSCKAPLVQAQHPLGAEGKRAGGVPVLLGVLS